MAATMHNIPSTVIMPEDAPKIKIDNTRKLGAKFCSTIDITRVVK